VTAVGRAAEALLERRLLVRLAPHLVRPLPFVVPVFAGARPDRLMGIGLNVYDVMATPGLRRRRAGRRGAAAGDDDQRDWSPERHRVISGEEVVAPLPALGPGQPTGGYLFYDCQTDDARLVLTVLGEAERFGAICVNRVEVTDSCATTGTAPGWVCSITPARRSLPWPPTTSSTPPESGPIGSSPKSFTRRPSCRASPPAAASWRSRSSPGCPTCWPRQFAVRHAQAQSLAELLLRRTRLGVLSARAPCSETDGALLAVAQAMAPELGWTQARVRTEIERFRAGAQAEGIVPPLG
jgi:glycerol-3-phosphate dehydrogenase